MKHSLTILGVVLVLSASGLGREARKVSCEGLVVDANGAPVAGAEVTLLDWKGNDLTSEREENVLARTTSDAKGAYLLEGKIDPAADAIVAARKKGLSFDFVVIARPAKEYAVLRLPGGAPLEGVVVDESNKPVAGAEVHAQAYVQGAMDILFLPAEAPLEWLRAKAGADGRFRVEDMPLRSRLHLEVSAAGKATTSTADECFSDLWAGSPHVPGENNIVIVMPAEAVVAGKVVEKATGKGLRDVMVYLCEPAVASPKPMLTDKDGAFRLGGLCAGRKSVCVIEPKDRLAEWAPASADVDARPGKTSEVKFELVKGGVLEVTVLDEESNEPVAGADAYVIDANGASPRTVYADAKGIARLRVEPDTAVRYAAAKAREYDTFSEEVGEFSEEKGQEPNAAVVATVKRFVMYRGVVKDASGRPLAGASVVSDESFSVSLNADIQRTGPHGEMVAAGKADDDQAAIIVRDPARNLVVAATLTDPNSEEDVKLEKGAALIARIVDEAGKPVPDGKLDISGDDTPAGGSRSLACTAVADANGYCLVKALLPGKYTLWARAHEYGEATIEVNLLEAGDVPTDAGTLALPLADQTVSGVVVDEKGKPVVGAGVDMNGESQPVRDPILTDGEGKFTFRKLAKASVTLSASKGELTGEKELDAPASGVKIVIKDESIEAPLMNGEDF